MPIPQVSTKDFDYYLPDDKIAKYPLRNRDESKLLIIEEGEFKEDIYKNIHEYLLQNSCMVFNNSKVIPARLTYLKPSGGIIEIFCLEPRDITPSEALMQVKTSRWICMIGGLKKWKKNENLEWTLPDHTVIEASYRNQSEFGVEVEFNWNGELTFAEVIEQLGDIPIPPYLLRKAEASDSIRYQTTYASISGSVAAPTAGLHFTEKVFESLKLKKIESLFLTLHVGAGTFKPVKANLAHEHEMHAEWVEIKKTLLQQLMQSENTIAVGTTSLRTLESIYWYAFLAVQKNSLFEEGYILPQFVAYTNVSNFSRKEVLKSLLHLMDIEKKESIFFKTQIMIMPSYKIRMVDYLVTNFHQPNSTLLMLISAVTKNKWKPIYEFALANNYRFLSYGDGCLIKIETTE